MLPKRFGICGPAGTGKTDLRLALAARLGVQSRAVGDFFREVADERKVGYRELEFLAMTDPSVDARIDGKMRSFATEYHDEGYVIDGRRILIVVPVAVPILVVCDDEIRFQRLFLRDAKKFGWTHVDQAREFTLAREAAVSARYLLLYGETLATLCEPDRYTIVLDSSRRTTPELISDIEFYYSE